MSGLALGIIRRGLFPVALVAAMTVAHEEVAAEHEQDEDDRGRAAADPEPGEQKNQKEREYAADYHPDCVIFHRDIRGSGAEKRGKKAGTRAA